MKRLREKASQSFPARRRGNKMKSVFGRDMCVDENTSQPTSVSVIRRSRTKLARGGCISLQQAALPLVGSYASSSRAPAQVSPPPKPTHRAFWPEVMAPPPTSSSSSRGTLAAKVLPVRSMLPGHLAGSMPSFFTAKSMMRWLAWWNTKRSMSSGVRPARSSTSRAQRGTASTAKRNTDWPSIWTWGGAAVLTPGT